ncbi:MAG: sarcosine oxidase subunit gamma family protein [Pseudomonadota bacterium]
MTGVTIKGANPRGMISVKAELAGSGVGFALTKATGAVVPEAGQVRISGDFAVLWMAPDELLVLCPRDRVNQTLGKITSTMGAGHFLAVDVSDARAGFTLAGQDGAVREVLARLTPADMHPDSFPLGHVRRTRLAQVAAAIWMTDAGAEVLAFRSVAEYVRGALENAADSPKIGHF